MALPVYVERAADTELLRALQKGQLCYILAARQIGKSQLCRQMVKLLPEQGVACVWVDINNLGTQATLNNWIFSLCKTILHALNTGASESLLRHGPLDSKALTAFWKGHADETDLTRWESFFRELALPAVRGKLVVILDEIDSLRQTPFGDELFAKIRALYEQQSALELQQLSFCLVGATSPGQLIEDATRTPFNVGHRIDLSDFSPEEAKSFLSPLRVLSSEPQVILDEILSWTAGHPYMTSVICDALLKDRTPSTPNSVASMVDAKFLRNGIMDHPNVGYPNHFISNHHPRPGPLVRLYRMVHRQVHVLARLNDPLHTDLLLLGLCTIRSGALVVRNRIIATIYDQSWAARHEVPEFFQAALDRWLKTGQPEDLIQGQQLKDAAAWAESLGGNLHSEEQEFLRKSHKRESELQEKDRALEQARLETAEEARRAAEAKAAAESALAQTAQANEEAAQARATTIELQRVADGERNKRRWQLGGMVGVALGLIILTLAGFWRSEAAARKHQTELRLEQERRAKLQAEKDEAERRVLEEQARTEAERRKTSEEKALTEKTTTALLHQKQLTEAATRQTAVEKQQRAAEGANQVATMSETPGRSLEAAEKYILVLGDFLGSKLGALVHQPKKLDDTLSKSGLRDAGIRAARNTIYARSLPHPAALRQVLFSPDSKYMTSVCEDGTVRMWDILQTRDPFRAGKEQQPQMVIPLSQEEVIAAAYAPVGETIALHTRLHEVVLWSLKEGKEIRRLKDVGDLSPQAFSADGKQLVTVSASSKHQVQKWDVSTGEVTTVDLAFLPLKDARYFPESNAVLVHGGYRAQVVNGSASLSIQESGDVGFALPLGTGDSPDRSAIVTSGDATLQQVARWDLHANRSRRIPLRACPNTITALALSDDQRWLGLACGAGVGEVWDVSSNRRLFWLEGHGPEHRVRSIAFSRDGQRIATAGDDGTVRLHYVGPSPGLDVPLVGEHSQSGKLQIVGQAAQVIRVDRNLVSIWNVHDGSRQAELLFEKPLLAATLTHQSSPMLAFSTPESVALVSVQDAHAAMMEHKIISMVHQRITVLPVPSLPTPPTNLPFVRMAVSEDQEKVLAWRQDGWLCKWKVHDGALLGCYLTRPDGAETDPVQYILPSKDGSRVGVVTQHAVRFWDIRDQPIDKVWIKPLLTLDLRLGTDLELKDGLVLAAVWSSNGRMLLIAQSKRLRRWELSETGLRLVADQPLPEAARAASFTTDLQNAIVAIGKTLRVYRVGNRQPLVEFSEKEVVDTAGLFGQHEQALAASDTSAHIFALRLLPYVQKLCLVVNAADRPAVKPKRTDAICRTILAKTDPGAPVN